mmetsp:Transcript_7145/g.14488  ORF Transcript_7145/g.14488 Transcript_7145/m.14488 type:complete len:262 (-) Transcript_7145:455-1240(-)
MVKLHNQTSRALAVVLRLLYGWQLGSMFYWFTMDHLHWFNYSGKPDQNQEYQHFHPVITMNYHYMFMLMAYPIPLTEAMVTPRVWRNMYGYSENAARNIQTFFHVAGFALLVCGIIFIHEEKEANEDAYLYSPHGWGGVFTVSLTFVMTLWSVVLWTLGTTNRFARRSLPWFNMWVLASSTIGFHNLGMGINQQHLYMACDNNYCKENMFLDIFGIQSQVIYIIAVFIACSEDRELVVHKSDTVQEKAPGKAEEVTTYISA